MKLTAIEREAVRLKYAGLCAYCGCPLPDRWHADHFQPVERKLAFGTSGKIVSTGEAWRPENHRLDNMMPSCPPCNISKGPLDLESWRKWLAGHLAALNKHHTPYRLVKAYGLVQETGKPVVFHFETVASAEPAGPASQSKPVRQAAKLEETAASVGAIHGVPA